MEQKNNSGQNGTRFFALLYTFIFLTILFLTGVSSASAGEKIYGDRASLGDGHVHTYIQYNDDGSPSAIGVQFSKSTLSNLPSGSDGNYCWDKNGNGQFEVKEHECLITHERILFLPKHNQNIPFKWVLLNWNPEGHPPPGVYDLPHFDIHFYTMDYLKRNSIRMGPCAEEMMDCDDLKKALTPVPPKFLPEEYISIGEAVAVPRMGMHLLNPRSPELLKPPENKKFTHTYFYGAYDGHITFFEPMITLAYFQSEPDVCIATKQPSEFETSGYYPTKYCIKFSPKTSQYTVSLEGMVKH